MSSIRLGNIDALRAFAALAVFVQHAFMDVVARGGYGDQLFALTAAFGGQ